METDIYTNCDECPDFGTYFHKELVNHFIVEHQYSIEEAEEFSEVLEQDSEELTETDNLYCRETDNGDDF